MSRTGKTLIHIFADTPHHYTSMCHFFAELALKNVEQHYWVRGKKGQQFFDSTLQNGIVYSTNSELIKLMKSASKDSKFIFHSMFYRSFLPHLLFSGLVNRCSWVCWGADVYQYERKDVKTRLARSLHTVIARKMSTVFALNSGDKMMVETLFNTNNVKTLPYPLFSSDNLNVKQNSSGVINILVGNSAAESNRHKEALDALSHFKNENINIIAPLNYGGEQRYVSEVISYGKSLFGDKFSPLTSMLSKEAYDSILGGIDVCVFAQNRQQGLYVIYTMLRAGKKVFLKKQSTTYYSLNQLGFLVNEFEDVICRSFDNFKSSSQNDTEKNAILMSKTFSKEALSKPWIDNLKGIFEGGLNVSN